MWAGSSPVRRHGAQIQPTYAFVIGRVHKPSKLTKPITRAMIDMARMAAERRSTCFNNDTSTMVEGPFYPRRDLYYANHKQLFKPRFGHTAPDVSECNLDTPARLQARSGMHDRTDHSVYLCIVNQIFFTYVNGNAFSRVHVVQCLHVNDRAR